MKIKKNDLVKIISGAYKGKIGRVSQIFPIKNKIQVENIGSYKKHIKPRMYKKYPDGGIIKITPQINISNVLFFSRKFNRAFRIGYKLDIKKNRYRIFKGKNVPFEFFI